MKRNTKLEKGGAARGPAKILVVHGPNLNLLGTREPAIYGQVPLARIDAKLVATGKAAGIAVSCFQSNHEGELIDRIHLAARDGVRGIIINPAGYTHTSVALRDALAAVAIPFIEVHLSNIHAREPFRRRSYFSDLAIGTLVGFGSQGYEMAMQIMLQKLREQP